MNDYRDDFLAIQNRPDMWQPVIKHRRLRMVKVGTWFFGLLNVYKLQFTEWEER